MRHVNREILQGLILAHLYAFVPSKCMCVFSLFLLPPLCCRFIPGPNSELPLQGCVPGSSPSSPLFLFPPNGLKLSHPLLLTGLPGTTEKDIHPDKTALLVWRQGFETRLIPCLINEPHVGDSPLPRSCGQFQTCTLPLSVSPSHRLTPPNLERLDRGYLEVVKTFI